MNATFEVLNKSLKESGFSSPAASDMAGYLISCLSRPAVTNVVGLIKDIDDIIKALEALKRQVHAEEIDAAISNQPLEADTWDGDASHSE